MEHRLMTEREKADIAMEAIRLMDDGREDEGFALHRTIPVAPYLAKYWKEKMGAEFLVKGGWNLAEAEVAYGQGWLDR
jgi:hypothetical protein